MNAATSSIAEPGIPDPRALRRARLIRAGVLLSAGIVIAFTATLHRDPVFDRWVIFACLAAIGVTTVVEFFALRATPASWLVAVRAALALVAAAAVLASQSAVDLAFVVATWAISSVAIAVARLAFGSQSRSVAVPSALLSGALALVVLVFRDDVIAIIGFFGAYAVVRAVFLGISAFDTAPSTRRTDDSTAPGDDSFAPVS